MNWIAALLLLIVVIVIAKKLKRASGAVNKKGDAQQFPYKKLAGLFSPAERSFLGVLNQAVGSDCQIFGKVRVADVLTPQKGLARRDWQIYFNKISAKHFDFVLCDKHDLRFLCAIELDDSSHNSKKRITRDAFLVGACQAAEFPLIQFKAKAAYNINDVRQSLAEFLPNAPSTNANHPAAELAPAPKPEPKAEPKPAIAEDQQPLSSYQKHCAKCASPMTKRITSKGQHKGKSFWGCSTYPKCNFIETDGA
jgi:ssDNA-binding Zn-finger/Zn-ribbon topoisomerase 1